MGSVTVNPASGEMEASEPAEFDFLVRNGVHDTPNGRTVYGPMKPLEEGRRGGSCFYLKKKKVRRAVEAVLEEDKKGPHKDQHAAEGAAPRREGPTSRSASDEDGVKPKDRSALSDDGAKEPELRKMQAAPRAAAHTLTDHDLKGFTRQEMVFEMVLPQKTVLNSVLNLKIKQAVRDTLLAILAPGGAGAHSSTFVTVPGFRSETLHMRDVAVKESTFVYGDTVNATGTPPAVCDDVVNTTAPGTTVGGKNAGVGDGWCIFYALSREGVCQGRAFNVDRWQILRDGFWTDEEAAIHEGVAKYCHRSCGRCPRPPGSMVKEIQVTHAFTPKHILHTSSRIFPHPHIRISCVSPYVSRDVIVCIQACREMHRDAYGDASRISPAYALPMSI